MKKDIVIYNVYIICCAMAEKNVPFKKAQEIMFQALEGDMDVLEILPVAITDNFTSVYADINMELDKLTPQDKKICVENLLKDTYLMLSYVDKTYDTSLPYIERERGKYNLILKQVTLSVFIDYLGKGENNKIAYNCFKEDYTKYCQKHIVKIAKMLDSKQTAGIEEAEREREAAANYIIDKYQRLKVCSIDFRTVHEDDIYIKNNTVPMAREEQEMFKFVEI